MAELDVSVGFGFALMGILYKCTQGGVRMCLGTLWESQHLGMSWGCSARPIPALWEQLQSGHVGNTLRKD